MPSLYLQDHHHHHLQRAKAWSAKLKSQAGLPTQWNFSPVSKRLAGIRQLPVNALICQESTANSPHLGPIIHVNTHTNTLKVSLYKRNSLHLLHTLAHTAFDHFHLQTLKTQIEMSISRRSSNLCVHDVSVNLRTLLWSYREMWVQRMGRYLGNITGLIWYWHTKTMTWCL